MALFGLGNRKIRDVVTLSIESSDLRYLATSAGRVTKWGSVPLVPTLVERGLVTNAVEMGKVIETLFAEQGLDTKRVVTGLSALRSVPRLLTLPNLQASVMEQTIAREARKEMPVSLEDLYLSWQSMPGANEQQQRIYVLGVPRDLVDAQVASLEAAGIRPCSMDLKPLALIRAVGQREAVILCLEDDVLDIVLVGDYVPEIVRTFSLARENLDEQGKLDRLIEELTQTVRFYNDSHRSAPIRPGTPAYVMGQGVSRREAQDYLRNVMDRTVERPSAPIPCPDDLPLAAFMTNLGLAMKTL
jgi:hypothetical protein